MNLKLSIANILLMDDNASSASDEELAEDYGYKKYVEYTYEGLDDAYFNVVHNMDTKIITYSSDMFMDESYNIHLDDFSITNDDGEEEGVVIYHMDGLTKILHCGDAIYIYYRDNKIISVFLHSVLVLRVLPCHKFIVDGSGDYKPFHYL